jgi:hypothetical protein
MINSNILAINYLTTGAVGVATDTMPVTTDNTETILVKFLLPLITTVVVPAIMNLLERRRERREEKRKQKNAHYGK